MPDDKQENLELIKTQTIQRANSNFQAFLQSIAPKITYWFLYYDKKKFSDKQDPLCEAPGFLYIDKDDHTFKAEDYKTVADFLQEYLREISILTRNQLLKVLEFRTLEFNLRQLVKSYVSDNVNEVLQETDDKILHDICPSFDRDLVIREFYEDELFELLDSVESYVLQKVSALEFSQVLEWGREKAIELREQERQKYFQELEENLSNPWPEWAIPVNKPVVSA